MDIWQTTITADDDVPRSLAACPLDDPHLILVFGAVARLETAAFFPALRTRFACAAFAGCSTAGEISNEGVLDGTTVVTAIRFRNARLRATQTHFDGPDDSHGAGRRIGEHLTDPALRNVLLFAQGVSTNGSALIDGFRAGAGHGAKLSGGLAGDGGAFRRTLVVSNEGVSDRHIVAVGFYDDNIRFGHGSFGGWSAFGPMRKVTRSSGNILFELDGAPALEVYKKYLGEYARDLPASGLLFPFSMRREDSSEVGLIRTILGVDEASGSLVLAGDIHPNGYLQLMHASTDALVDGAQTAAETARDILASGAPALSILISCVGRKMVMGARVDEEVEAVSDVFGSQSVIAGFYSHGEISPLLAAPECMLHNQTMTITCIREDR